MLSDGILHFRSLLDMSYRCLYRAGNTRVHACQPYPLEVSTRPYLFGLKWGVGLHVCNGEETCDNYRGARPNKPPGC
jgi:hypothetical protein